MCGIPEMGGLPDEIGGGGPAEGDWGALVKVMFSPSRCSACYCRWNGRGLVKVVHGQPDVCGVVQRHGCRYRLGSGC